MRITIIFAEIDHPKSNWLKSIVAEVEFAQPWTLNPLPALSSEKLFWNYRPGPLLLAAVTLFL